MSQIITIEELDKYIGTTIILYGWVSKIRNHGGIIFFHLRNFSHEVQVTTEAEIKINNEDFVEVHGFVKSRPIDMINEKILSGHLEISLIKLDIISESSPLPFEIERAYDVRDELKLQYRTLYLRNSTAKSILKKCIVIKKALREQMEELGFCECDTPTLSASSPEGARDFIVPTILHPGMFYALTQSPQIYKQLLTSTGFFDNISGKVNGYYQFAHCYRNENSRNDRTPGEFIQLDYELCLPRPDMEYLENLIKNIILPVFKKFSTRNITYTSMSYKNAIDTYASDKPDLRNPLIINDYTKYVEEFVDKEGNKLNIFINEVKKGGIIRGIFYPYTINHKKIEDWATLQKFKVAYAELKAGQITGSIGKFISQDLFNKYSINQEDGTIFFICDETKRAIKNLDLLRTFLGESLLKDEYSFVFVYDFPMFSTTDVGGWDFEHNPFSLPKVDITNNSWKQDPKSVLAYQYDLVCNGAEIASGGIRNYNLKLLFDVFDVCGQSEEEVKNKYRSMLYALQFGPCPTAGAAFGFERICMLLTDAPSYKEVCFFPMNSNGRCELTQCPSQIPTSILAQLGIKII